MNTLFREASTNTGPFDVFSRSPYFGFRREKYMEPPMKAAAPINIVWNPSDAYPKIRIAVPTIIIEIPGHLRRFSVSMLADDTFRVPYRFSPNAISDVPIRIPLESE